MNIALVYDLRDEYRAAGYGEEDVAEFDMPGTIDALARALGHLGHDVVRVGNVRALAARLVAGERWDLVFNIAEGLAGFGREAQVPALLDAFGLGYTFSDPLVASLTLHKAMTKRVLRDSGVATAPFCTVEREEDADAVELGWPVFAKPVAEGTAKGIDAGSKLDSRAALRARCRELLARYRQPVLVEPYLPGREFTVGVLGSGGDARAIGTLEVRLRAGAEAHSYTYRNKEQCERLCEFPRADASAAASVEPVALAAWRAVGARDAGRVDLRLGADGRPYVLEINPLPGLHPEHSDLPILCTAVGMPYERLIDEIVRSAAARAKEARPLRLPGPR
jgi:D-alanine-D-alanine ligase